MPRIAYQRRKFQWRTEVLINRANSIIDEYVSEGYVLTLRQLYYQLVARDIIPNKQTEYNRLGDIINKARLAGLIDWEAIEDRTRNLASLPHWVDPSQIIASCASQFQVDSWLGQPNHVEVWVEKEALAGVIQRIADRWDCAWLSCRGYMSQSEMWAAGQRLARITNQRRNVVILHLGDHDPSGLDMTRDIRDRLGMFVGAHGEPDRLEVRRVALTYDQVRQYDPPPNPAKQTDSRFQEYASQYGDESWELDALPPTVLDELISEHIKGLLDEDRYYQRRRETETGRGQLSRLSLHYEEATDFIAGLQNDEED